jgi:hypothetical protein
MNNLQNVKVVNVTPPAAIVDNASFATTTIDTFGFNKLAVYFQLGATDIAMTALKLQESDDSGMSGAADITGAVYGASGYAALPTATDDNKIFGFFIDLKGRKRYIDVVATAGDGSTGTYGACTAHLYNGLATTDDATERGLAANLIVG